MKKILLIIVIAFCIFQMVVLADVIDTGSAAIDTGSSQIGGTTWVLKDNPADGTGRITLIEIWADTDLTGVQIATFYVVSGNNLSTRDTQNIGNITGGSKQIVGVDLDIVEGDFIGIYWTSIDEDIDCSTSGYPGLWHLIGDQIPCTNATFGTAYITWTLSFYGTGTTAAIDIGSLATDRTSNMESWTMVNKDNPANESGKITSVEIWARTGWDLINCEVATFYVVSGNNLSTRDSQAIGTVTGGSKQTIPVDLEVEAGDYIGIWYTAGMLKLDGAGYAGVWRVAGDNIPCMNVEFDGTTLPDATASLYGTGAIIGWDHKWNTLTIGKWNTKEIMKWNALE